MVVIMIGLTVSPFHRSYKTTRLMSVYVFTSESGFVRVYSLDWVPMERNKQTEREREREKIDRQRRFVQASAARKVQVFV